MNKLNVKDSEGWKIVGDSRVILGSEGTREKLLLLFLEDRRVRAEEC